MGFLSGWSSRKQIDVQTANLDSNLTDFPILVKITADSDMTEALATGNDIRFTQSDGETLLKYEKQSWSGGNGSAVTAIFWVKTDLSTSGTSIYIYYGNSGASDGEDGTNVWDSNFKGVWHFEESSSPSYDSTSNNWDLAWTGSVSQITGIVGNGIEVSGTTPSNSVYGTCSSWSMIDGTIEAFGDSISGHNSYEARAEINGSADFSINYRINPGYSAIAINNRTTYIATALPSGWFALVGKSTYNGPVEIYLNASHNSSSNQTYGSINVTNMTIKNTYSTLVSRWDELRVSDTLRAAAWIKFYRSNIAESDNELTWGSEESAPAGGTGIQINIGDTWKEVAGMQINIGDTWKAVAGVQINIGDTWKTVF